MRTQIDLLETALDAAARRHERDRQYILAQAQAFAHIHETLDSLASDGFTLAAQDVHIEPGRYGAAPALVVTVLAARGIHRSTAAAMRAHGLNLHGVGGATGTEVWRHPAGWMLALNWITRADTGTAAWLPPSARDLSAGVLA